MQKFLMNENEKKKVNVRLDENFDLFSNNKGEIIFEVLLAVNEETMKTYWYIHTYVVAIRKG